MKIYKVEMNIDTGYDWYRRMCILNAANECDAGEKASRYINEHLHGETFADVESIIEITVKDDIIYQDYFKVH